MARLNVRGTAHEQQPVECLEQLLERELAANRRHNQRQTPSRVEHGGYVFLAGHVIGVGTEHASVRRYTDDRAPGSHDCYRVRAQELYGYTVCPDA